MARFTEAQYRTVLAAHPYLTTNGFGAYVDAVRLAFAGEKYEKQRGEMYTPAVREEFDRACEWLSTKIKTKNPNRWAGTSYGLKHAAERAMRGYICNGAFITAAYAMGFSVQSQRKCDGPNPWIGIALKGLHDGDPRLE